MSLVGLAAQHSPLAFSPLMERHTLQYSSSPSLGSPSEGEEVFYIYITIDLFFVFKWQSGICCLLMPQVSDFQCKAWLLHRREIGLMCQPIRHNLYNLQ